MNRFDVDVKHILKLRLIPVHPDLDPHILIHLITGGRMGIAGIGIALALVDEPARIKTPFYKLVIDEPGSFYRKDIQRISGFQRRPGRVTIAVDLEIAILKRK